MRPVPQEMLCTAATIEAAAQRGIAPAGLGPAERCRRSAADPGHMPRATGLRPAGEPRPEAVNIARRPEAARLEAVGIASHPEAVGIASRPEAARLEAARIEARRAAAGSLIQVEARPGVDRSQAAAAERSRAPVPNTAWNKTPGQLPLFRQRRRRAAWAGTCSLHATPHGFVPPFPASSLNTFSRLKNRPKSGTFSNARAVPRRFDAIG
jgi:hypothetical protein